MPRPRLWSQPATSQFGVRLLAFLSEFGCLWVLVYYSITLEVVQGATYAGFAFALLVDLEELITLANKTGWIPRIPNGGCGGIDFCVIVLLVAGVFGYLSERMGGHLDPLSPTDTEGAKRVQNYQAASGLPIVSFVTIAWHFILMLQYCCARSKRESPQPPKNPPGPIRESTQEPVPLVEVVVSKSGDKHEHLSNTRSMNSFGSR